ncbi:MAG TPA: OmpA family protein [Phaeodactylibacter sp.]|nr:OmpA family protein [Phaeodactylibacter sp.]
MLQKTYCTLFLFFLVKIAIAQSSPFDSIDLLVQKNVYFDFGKYNLTSESENVLLSIVDSCVGKTNLKLHIEAHTDDIGTNENNYTLSKQRSQAVKNFFAQHQIPTENITTSVFGESRPVADNTSDNGRQQNRRATISLFLKKKMTAIKGQIVDKKTGEGMKGKVIFHTKSHKDSVITADNGFFEKSVEENTVLGIDIYKKDYFFETQMIKAKGKNTVVMTIPLLPIEVGEKVTIKNLYFVGNRAILLPKSKPELPKILKFMQLNPDLKIEIAGHINKPFVSSSKLKLREWTLSTNRAKLVYDYLIENNIAADRLKFKGYGNTQMKFPRAKNEREQAMNRRVEIHVLEVRNIAKSKLEKSKSKSKT